jgi:putative FmdB family regulatory protein
MTYVFNCKDCGNIFEISGGFDISLQNHQCPNCKSNNTHKIITNPNVIYKGNGWTRKKDENNKWKS